MWGLYHPGIIWGPADLWGMQSWLSNGLSVSRLCWNPIIVSKSGNYGLENRPVYWCCSAVELHFGWKGQGGGQFLVVTGCLVIAFTTNVSDTCTIHLGCGHTKRALVIPGYQDLLVLLCPRHPYMYYKSIHTDRLAFQWPRVDTKNTFSSIYLYSERRETHDTSRYM